MKWNWENSQFWYDVRYDKIINTYKKKTESILLKLEIYVNKKF